MFSAASGQIGSLTVKNFWASQIGSPNISITSQGDVIGYADRAWYCPNYIFVGGGLHISLTGSTRGIHWSGSNADWWLRVAADASGGSFGDLEIYGTSQCVRSYRPIVADQTVWARSGVVANMQAIAPKEAWGVLNFEDSGDGDFFYNSGGSACSFEIYEGSATGNRPIWMQGVVGSAISFCGVDDSIRCTSLGMSGVSVFTFAGWMYWKRTTANQIFLEMGLEGTNAFMYFGAASATSGLNLNMAASGYAGGTQVATLPNIFRPEEWHHYIIQAGAYQNGYLTAYRDGTMVGSIAISHVSGVRTGTTANHMYIGNYFAEYNAGWSGMMDEIMWWGNPIPIDKILEQISPYPRRDAQNDVVWQLRNPAHSIVFRNPISGTSVFASVISGASYQNSPKFPTTLHSAGISIAAAANTLASFTISPLAGYSGLMPMSIYYAYQADVGSVENGTCTCRARLSDATLIVLDTKTSATGTVTLPVGTIIASIGTGSGRYVKDIILTAGGSDDGTSKIYNGSIQTYLF